MTKKIEVSDEVYEALKAFTSDFNQTPDEVLKSLLHLPTAGTASDPLFRFTQSPAFRALHSDADRYLAILGFVYEYHAPEFRDFVEHLSSGRKYFGKSPDDIKATSTHNQARRIPKSPYWAIMNIDTATKRRFLRRALEFVGYRDSTVLHICGLIGKH